MKLNIHGRSSVDYVSLWVSDCTLCVTRTDGEGIAVRSLWWIAEQEETDYDCAIAKFVSLLLSASAASLFGRPR